MDDESTNERKSKVVRHTDLEVFQVAFENAMELFRLSKKFPGEERYSLTDQVRRSSRSVAANITEAWRRRRYEKSFISKLNDAEAEAAETQTWIQSAVKCDYLTSEQGRTLYRSWDSVIAMLVKMQNQPEVWCLKK